MNYKILVLFKQNVSLGEVFNSEQKGWTEEISEEYYFMAIHTFGNFKNFIILKNEKT